jgi:hypothetical protein
MRGRRGGGREWVGGSERDQGKEYDERGEEEGEAG